MVWFVTLQCLAPFSYVRAIVSIDANFFSICTKKATFSILHTYFYKTLTLVYLLYTLFSLNNHFIFFFFYISTSSLVNPTFSLFFSEHYSLSLSLSFSLSHTVNFLSFSSFSHLSSPVKFSSFAPFFTKKLHKQTKKLHFNTNPCQSNSIWVGSSDGNKADAAATARHMRRQQQGRSGGSKDGRSD